MVWGSFFVENKCMARGSLKKTKEKKQKKYFLSYVAMVAHIPPPQPMVKKSPSTVNTKKKTRTDESFLFIVAVSPLCKYF